MPYNANQVAPATEPGAAVRRELERQRKLELEERPHHVQWGPFVRRAVSGCSKGMHSCGHGLEDFRRLPLEAAWMQDGARIPGRGVPTPGTANAFTIAVSIRKGNADRSSPAPPPGLLSAPRCPSASDPMSSRARPTLPSMRPLGSRRCDGIRRSDSRLLSSRGGSGSLVATGLPPSDSECATACLRLGGAATREARCRRDAGLDQRVHGHYVDLRFGSAELMSSMDSAHPGGSSRSA